MLTVPDITITSLDEIKAFSLTGAPRFILDELQNATIANTEDKVDITGKGGRKLNSLKRNKAVTISGTNGLISAGMLEAQTGGVFEQMEAAPVEWTDYLTVNGGEATTEYVAVGTAGAEIKALYIRDAATGAATKKLEQDATAAEGKFAYDPETRKLTLSETDAADGSEITVFYTRSVAASVLTNNSESYSEKLRLYVDGTGEDKCGNHYHIQFMIPKADFNGNFDIELGGDQAVHAFEAESLAGACGTGGALWTYTVFGLTEAAA